MKNHRAQAQDKHIRHPINNLNRNPSNHSPQSHYYDFKHHNNFLHPNHTHHHHHHHHNENIEQQAPFFLDGLGHNEKIKVVSDYLTDQKRLLINNKAMNQEQRDNHRRRSVDSFFRYNLENYINKKAQPQDIIQEIHHKNSNKQPSPNSNKKPLNNKQISPHNNIQLNLFQNEQFLNPSKSQNSYASSVNIGSTPVSKGGNPNVSIQKNSQFMLNQSGSLSGSSRIATNSQKNRRQKSRGEITNSSSNHITHVRQSSRDDNLTIAKQQNKQNEKTVRRKSCECSRCGPLTLYQIHNAKNWVPNVVYRYPHLQLYFLKKYGEKFVKKMKHNEYIKGKQKYMQKKNQQQQREDLKKYGSQQQMPLPSETEQEQPKNYKNLIQFLHDYMKKKFKIQIFNHRNAQRQEKLRNLKRDLNQKNMMYQSQRPIKTSSQNQQQGSFLNLIKNITPKQDEQQEQKHEPVNMMEISIGHYKAPKEEQKTFKLDLRSLPNQKNQNQNNNQEISNFMQNDESSQLEISFVSDTSSFSENRSPKSIKKRRSTLISSFSSQIKNQQGGSSRQINFNNPNKINNVFEKVQEEEYDDTRPQKNQILKLQKLQQRSHQTPKHGSTMKTGGTNRSLMNTPKNKQNFRSYAQASQSNNNDQKLNSKFFDKLKKSNFNLQKDFNNKSSQQQQQAEFENSSDLSSFSEEGFFYDLSPAKHTAHGSHSNTKKNSSAESVHTKFQKTLKKFSILKHFRKGAGDVNSKKSPPQIKSPSPEKQQQQKTVDSNTSTNQKHKKAGLEESLNLKMKRKQSSIKSHDSLNKILLNHNQNSLSKTQIQQQQQQENNNNPAALKQQKNLQNKILQEVIPKGAYFLQTEKQLIKYKKISGKKVDKTDRQILISHQSHNHANKKKLGQSDLGIYLNSPQNPTSLTQASSQIFTQTAYKNTSTTEQYYTNYKTFEDENGIVTEEELGSSTSQNNKLAKKKLQKMFGNTTSHTFQPSQQQSYFNGPPPNSSQSHVVKSARIQSDFNTKRKNLKSHEKIQSYRHQSNNDLLLSNSVKKKKSSHGSIDNIKFQSPRTINKDLQIGSGDDISKTEFTLPKVQPKSTSNLNDDKSTVKFFKSPRANKIKKKNKQKVQTTKGILISQYMQ